MTDAAAAELVVRPPAAYQLGRQSSERAPAALSELRSLVENLAGQSPDFRPVKPAKRHVLQGSIAIDRVEGLAIGAQFTHGTTSTTPVEMKVSAVSATGNAVAVDR